MAVLKETAAPNKHRGLLPCLHHLPTTSRIWIPTPAKSPAGLWPSFGSIVPFRSSLQLEG